PPQTTILLGGSVMEEKLREVNRIKGCYALVDRDLRPPVRRSDSRLPELIPQEVFHQSQLMKMNIL
ncbi:Histidine--tRNA ligase, partial [Dissostichus eleginoides]